MADDTLDFAAAHDRKHGPDPEFVTRDERGRKWFKFICSYEIDGSHFGFQIWALSAEDAEARMKAIAATGKIDGQLFHEITP